MSSEINKRIFNPNFINNKEYPLSDISGQTIIDMTNHFYLEMSKNIITEQEYEIMHKILIEHRTFQSISAEYCITKEKIRCIYKEAFIKIKLISDTTEEINVLKKRRDRLHREYLSEYQKLKIGKIEDLQKNIPVSDKSVIDSSFPFSTRLWNMFIKLEIYTFKDLFEDPLSMYPKYRGFKGKCLQEFIQFIEFENIEDCFEDNFYEFKEKYDIS